VARFVVGVVAGIVISTLSGAALQLHAQDMGDGDVQTGVDGSDQDASASDVVPDLTADSPVVQVPSIPAALATRVACIEAKESGGANVWNSQGSGAGGVLQYYPSTFARGAREIGHPEYSLWVPWQARIVAAHDLAMGRRSQWTVGGC
jgi:hypothetical protein